MKAFRWFGTPKHPMQPEGGWLTWDEALQASSLVAGRRRTVQVTRKVIDTAPKKAPMPRTPVLDATITHGQGIPQSSDKGVRYGWVEVVATTTDVLHLVSLHARLRRMAVALRRRSCISSVVADKLPMGGLLLINGPYEAPLTSWFPSCQSAVTELAPKFKLRIVNKIEVPTGSTWLWIQQCRPPWAS